MARADAGDKRGKLSVVTGASSGIGLELARLCAADGMTLLIASDEPDIATVRDELAASGVQVEALQVDLATRAGVQQLIDAVRALGPVEYLIANAGHGLGHAFLDEAIADIDHVIDTNVRGTVWLLHALVGDMKRRGQGRVLITGSIAGILPGSFSAIYNGTKAFIDNFAYALGNELKETGVTVTCLMPGPTDTNFFARADMLDTKVGKAETKKDDPADVANTGYQAMMKGEASVVHGMANKMQAAMANILPKTASAESHRKMAEPGSAKDH
ncbi:MAG: SDR family NAD(P)-dependent oxidoreductase [Alphaproteobacteria bacterium]|nr:MAG: SDR family NAD(P)-dependent oxidoreductase [Alphaproteobacteria bacterium]